MAISVLNTDAGLSGTTLVNAESAQTVTGLKTFDRDPNAPFAVSAGSAVVTNLDADKLDGLEASAFARPGSAGTFTADQTFNDNVNITLGTGGDADIYYDGTDMVVDTAVVGSGALSLSKGMLKFPAVQNASANANTLDDYEEGTWTPTDVSGAGLTLTVNSATYIKIGQLVHLFFDITWPAQANGTQARIGNFPFTNLGTTNCYGGFNHYSGYGTAFAWNMQGLNASSAFAYAVGGGSVTNGNLTGATVRGTIIYRASA